VDFRLVVGEWCFLSDLMVETRSGSPRLVVADVIDQRVVV
jgi:hypothetical protein